MQTIQTRDVEGWLLNSEKYKNYCRISDSMEYPEGLYRVDTSINSVRDLALFHHINICMTVEIC